MRQGNLFYGLFKSIADSLLTEEKRVECFCESDHCIVIDFFLLLDANDVLGAGLNEDLTDELAMARSYNDKFEHLAFLFVVPLNHFFKCKRTDQNTFTLFSLQQKQISLIQVLLVKLASKLIYIVSEAMSTEMYRHRVLSQDLVQ